MWHILDGGDEIKIIIFFLTALKVRLKKKLAWIENVFLTQKTES